MILRLLQANWPFIGMTLIASLALMFGYMTMLKLDTCSANLKAEQVRTASLSASIQRQNDGINALVQASKQNREVYLAGLKAAEKKAVRLEIDAADILNRQPPADPQFRCQWAADVLRDVTQ